MTYDGKLLALARAGLEKDRETNLAEHQRRIDEAYYRISELEQIDLTLRSHMAELFLRQFSLKLEIRLFGEPVLPCDII